MVFTDDLSARLATVLHDAGVRVTRQRVALLFVLRDATDHPDAEGLLENARQVEPAISLATVYRTLTVLEAAGLAHRHSFEGGGARYEMATRDHHDHIVDLESGEVMEFNSEEIERLQNEIVTQLGYEMIHHRMELYCKKRKP